MCQCSFIQLCLQCVSLKNRTKVTLSSNKYWSIKYFNKRSVKTTQKLHNNLQTIHKQSNSINNVQPNQVKISHQSDFYNSTNTFMEILSSFPHPPLAPDLFEFHPSVKHKEWCTEECWEITATDFHSRIFCTYYASQWLQHSSATISVYCSLYSREERHS